MKKAGGLWLLLIVVMLLSGCRVHAAEPVTVHLVTQIDVHYRQDADVLCRQYTQPRKMEAVLNYLRLTEYAGMPEDDPELHRGDVFKITVHLSGGGNHIYYLHADRYLSTDYRPWEQVEPPQPLIALLQSLPADK